MAIENDFTVYPYSKVIRHVSGTTVYNVADFYTYLMDLFDEPAYGSYEKPCKYNTPTSYTMLNEWWIDIGDGSEVLKYLKNGSIDTSGYTSGHIYFLEVDDGAGSYVDYIPGDKDGLVTGGAVEAIGPLLGYKNNYPDSDTGYVWVRDLEAAGTNIPIASPREFSLPLPGTTRTISVKFFLRVTEAVTFQFSSLMAAASSRITLRSTLIRLTSHPLFDSPRVNRSRSLMESSRLGGASSNAIFPSMGEISLTRLCILDVASFPMPVIFSFFSSVSSGIRTVISL